MDIYPAIDLHSGNVVRLRQGDYSDMTVYSPDPLEAARGFEAGGATHLHIVDLDAAKGEGQQNLDAIRNIARAVDMFIEVGGGARSEESIGRYLDLGVDRVIIGSMAVENPAFTLDAAKLYPGVVAVGVDAKDGFVAIHGWREVTDIDAIAFVEWLVRHGITHIIYTDISRDGMLEGPNFAAYERLSQVEGLNVIASGGVSSVSDIRRLARLNLDGAIIGKALYDGRISLSEALEAGRGTN